MRDFGDGLAHGASEEFERWMADNPNGYYVNLLSARRGLLHRGGCSHMRFAPGQANLVAHPKWTSMERGELERRASRENVELALCSDCDV